MRDPRHPNNDQVFPTQENEDDQILNSHKEPESLTIKEVLETEKFKNFKGRAFMLNKDDKTIYFRLSTPFHLGSSLGVLQCKVEVVKLVTEQHLALRTNLYIKKADDVKAITLEQYKGIVENVLMDFLKVLDAFSEAERKARIEGFKMLGYLTEPKTILNHKN